LTIFSQYGEYLGSEYFSRIEMLPDSSAAAVAGAAVAGAAVAAAAVAGAVDAGAAVAGAWVGACVAELLQAPNMIDAAAATASTRRMPTCSMRFLLCFVPAGR
jgi:hypothetical protein